MYTVQHKGDAIVAGIARVLVAGKFLFFSDADDCRGDYTATFEFFCRMFGIVHTF